MEPWHENQKIPVNMTYKKHAEESGCGLHATIDIPARDCIISIERPLVISLDIPRLKDTCYWCLGYRNQGSENPKVVNLEGDSKLQICTGCHVVRYCTKVGTAFPENQSRCSLPREQNAIHHHEKLTLLRTLLSQCPLVVPNMVMEISTQARVRSLRPVAS